ncbi:acyltransferase [Chloroflexota bacterium]
MTQTSQSSSQPRRRRELDAMGLLVVVGLVFFHSAQIFYYADFFVKNEPPNIQSVSQLVSTLLVAFAGLWGMPLLFLIAGLAIWYSLRKRSAGQFALERTRRLVVPLVVGTILLVPPMVYYGQKSDPAYQETYLQFLPRFFNIQLSLDFPRFLSGAPPDELFTIFHLWFLEYLFVFTLVLLPLWLFLRRPAGQRLVDRFGDFCALPWAIFSLALPIAIIEAALGTEFAGGWNRYAYIPFLIYGFLMAADGRLGHAFQRHRRSALILGLVALLLYFAGSYMLGPAVQLDAQTEYDPAHVLFRSLKGFAGWFWVVVIMGVAVGVGQKQSQGGTEPVRDSRPEPSATPRRPSLLDRAAGYAGEAQLPFYVLHMTPIVVIGFYVVQWEINALVKYGVIVLATLGVVLVVYDIGVRRTRLTRFLFGMKPSTTRTGQAQSKVEPE